MVVTAVISISQFPPQADEGSVRELAPGIVGDTSIRETPLAVSSWSRQTHQPAVTQPAASSITGGWSTRTPYTDFWSDSPTHQPNLLYRNRFAFGRDIQELFAQPAVPGQDFQPVVSGDGVRWGKLDENSGVLMYERPFSLALESNVLEFWVYESTSIRETLHASNSNASVHELGTVTGEFTVKEYPFLLNTLPVPDSVKNPISTDIYIRLGNFTSVFDPDSFVLYIDDSLQTGLVVEEFFSGLGGFDVTWNNSFLFEYDAQVDVRWEFQDLTVPANLFEISYPFYTVPDSSGPRITNLVPDDQALNIPIQGTIQFDMEDFETDVDADSLLLYVNSVKVEDGVTGTLTLIRFQNEKGYTVQYTPKEPWLYGDLIPVAIFVKDKSVHSNETFFTYNFTTIESTAPRLLNLKPLSCTISVPTGTHVGLDIVDGGHGLNKSSIVFAVEEVERSGQIILIPIVHRDE